MVGRRRRITSWVQFSERRGSTSSSECVWQTIRHPTVGWVTHSTHVRSVLYGGAFSSSAVKRLITTSKRDARMTTRRGPTPMRRRCPMTRSIFRRPTPLTLIGDLAQRLTANFRYEKRKSGVCYRRNNKKKKKSFRCCFRNEAEVFLFHSFRPY